MRHLRMVGLALVAVFATAAVVATSASASLPEFGKCEVAPTHEGKYTDKNCTVKAKKVNEKFTGGFEFRKATELANKSFQGQGGAGVLNVIARFCEGKVGSERTKACEAKGIEQAAIAVECETERAHGEVTGTKEVTNVSVKFQGCKLFGSIPCSNTSNEGEINVNPLKGKLGYINKLKKEVGVDLNPKTKKGEFAKFNCSGVGIVVGTWVKGEPGEPEPVYKPSGGGDGIISPISPVNTMTTKYTQTYTTTAGDENIPNKFAGTAPLQVLEAYGFNAEEPANSQLWSKAGEIITNVNTLLPEGEEGEIKG
jgi:hypothetical protein